MSSEQTLFPFVRIVGQDEMKRALLLNIVDSSIGGVLLKGEKGTAKSTAVRSLAQVLPESESVSGCIFHCAPGNPRRMCEDCRRSLANGTELKTYRRRMSVVELPLSSTEDRISGSLDIEHILKSGEKKFDAGVLAQANGNLLYVDEVNLLDDHIVDLLLDSAAMGVNYVEREGISYSHPARFILVGTMNPEEGTLRPQLLDRFGLSVDIKGERDVGTRVEVIKRRLEYDRDPEAYLEACNGETEALRDRIVSARDTVSDVRVTDELVKAVAVVSIRLGIEGHRADLALIRAARANAALEGRDIATKEDIMAPGAMVLTHRLKKGPFEEAVLKPEDLARCLAGY